MQFHVESPLQWTLKPTGLQTVNPRRQGRGNIIISGSEKHPVDRAQSRKPAPWARGGFRGLTWGKSIDELYFSGLSKRSMFEWESQRRRQKDGGRTLKYKSSHRAGHLLDLRINLTLYHDEAVTSCPLRNHFRYSWLQAYWDIIAALSSHMLNSLNYMIVPTPSRWR